MAAPSSQLLASEKIGELGFAAYRPRNKFQGVPLKRCLWIGPDEQYASIPEAVWLESNIPSSRIVLRSSSSLSNAAAVKSGLACAVLPVILGDNDKDMVRIAADVLLHREIWLLQRRGTPSDGAVGVTATWLAQVFKAVSSQLRG
jgi:DNA-binding transcriptional LysR family regulator